MRKEYSQLWATMVHAARQNYSNLCTIWLFCTAPLGSVSIENRIRFLWWFTHFGCLFFLYSFRLGNWIFVCVCCVREYCICACSSQFWQNARKPKSGNRHTHTHRRWFQSWNYHHPFMLDHNRFTILMQFTNQKEWTKRREHLIGSISEVICIAMTNSRCTSA